jgi:SAM-dependent MidA family methyltransferase
MQLALHHPLCGYYSKLGDFGESGDFYTSPELHPLFAAAVAVRAHGIWQMLDAPDRFDFVEVGGGSGRFARDFLAYVEECLPDFARAIQYRIDDRGARLRAIQHQRLIEAHLDRRVRWTDGAPLHWAPDSIRGMIFANELLDAFAVHLVTARGGELQELYVRLSHDGLELEPGPPSTPRLAWHLASLNVVVPDGVQWEINLNAGRWMKRASRALAAGGMLIVDYGYDSKDLYNAKRPSGTLLCYSRHAVNSDPLRDPGGQDMTTHVDLTSLRADFENGGAQMIEDRPQSEALAPSVDAWRAWTQHAEGAWTRRAGLIRSLDALIDVDGLGRLRWVLGARGAKADKQLVEEPMFPPHSYKLLDDHLALPDPATIDPISDIESQWRELWEES